MESWLKHRLLMVHDMSDAPCTRGMVYFDLCALRRRGFVMERTRGVWRCTIEGERMALQMKEGHDEAT